jgi:hypothetical protein
MTFTEMLEGKKEKIVARWLDDALSMYVQDASALFARQKDQFANPVGHSLREGTLAIFEALVSEGSAEEIRQHLGEIIKIRAVQQFSASSALCFIFRLKDIVREEVAEILEDAEILPEYLLFERKVDEVALTAFEVYLECREQLFEIRASEMKRSVSWVVNKLNERENAPELVGAGLENESPKA